MPRKKNASSDAPRTSFRCQRCNRAVRIPKGWDTGSAVRRHYWAKHADVMQPLRSRR